MNPENEKPKNISPGGRTFKYVQENWSSLEKNERVSLSMLIVLMGKKNQVEKSLKGAVINLIRKKF